MRVPGKDYWRLTQLRAKQNGGVEEAAKNWAYKSKWASRPAKPHIDCGFLLDLQGPRGLKSARPPPVWEPSAPRRRGCEPRRSAHPAAPGYRARPNLFRPSMELLLFDRMLERHPQATDSINSAFSPHHRCRRAARSPVAQAHSTSCLAATVQHATGYGRPNRRATGHGRMAPSYWPSSQQDCPLRGVRAEQMAAHAHAVSLSTALIFPRFYIIIKTERFNMIMPVQQSNMLVLELCIFTSHHQILDINTPPFHSILER